MLVAALILVMASDGAALPVPRDAKVRNGIAQARDGLLEAAVATFEEAIVDLAKPGGDDRGDLLIAHVHRGAALVALQGEDAAKDAFRKALTIQPALRLRKGEFTDRVVRVFDAARTGKAKSVMARPTGATKKAGIGAAGIAAVVGGGTLLAGGAAVAATRGDSAPPATGFQIVSAIPPPGSTLVIGADRPGPVVLRLTFSGRSPISGTYFVDSLVKLQNAACLAPCCPSGRGPQVTLVAGQEVQFEIPYAVAMGYAPPCPAAPFRTGSVDLLINDTSYTNAYRQTFFAAWNVVTGN